MSAIFQRMLDLGKTEDEVHTLYKSWATHYDEDVNGVGYLAPTHAARVVMETVKPKAGERIVDFAAGTGCVGQCLRAAGLDALITVDAVDASPEMMSVAREKKVYDNFFLGFIGGGAELPFEKESYDVATMVGGFADGHIHIDGWDFILDAVKPGGHVVCSITKKWVDAIPEYSNMEEYVVEMCDRKGAEIKERRVFEKSYSDYGLIVWVLQKKIEMMFLLQSN